MKFGNINIHNPLKRVPGNEVPAVGTSIFGNAPPRDEMPLPEGGKPLAETQVHSERVARLGRIAEAGAQNGDVFTQSGALRPEQSQWAQETAIKEHEIGEHIQVPSDLLAHQKPQGERPRRAA